MGAALRGAIGAEWIKLWSIRSTWWASVGAAVSMVGCAAVMGMDFAHDVENGETTDGSTMAVGDPATNAVLLTQFAVVAIAMAVVTAEFGTGTIRATLAADPRRGRVLFAKAVVVAAVTLPLGLVSALAGVGVGRPALGEHGVTESGAVAGDVAAIVAYLVLTALLTVGVGAMLRGSVATLSAILAVMLALPMLFATPSTRWLPGSAGMDLLDGDAFAGFVLAAWVMAALLGGGWALRRRDV